MGFWLVIIVLLFFGFQLLYLDSKKEYNLSYSTFIQQVDKGNIAEATQNEREITGRLAKKETLATDDGSQQQVESFKVILPVQDPKLIERIQDKNPNAVIKGKLSGMNWWGAILTSSFH